MNLVTFLASVTSCGIEFHRLTTRCRKCYFLFSGCRFPPFRFTEWAQVATGGGGQSWKFGSCGSRSVTIGSSFTSDLPRTIPVISISAGERFSALACSQRPSRGRGSSKAIPTDAIPVLCLWDHKFPQDRSKRQSRDWKAVALLFLPHGIRAQRILAIGGLVPHGEHRGCDFGCVCGSLRLHPGCGLLFGQQTVDSTWHTSCRLAQNCLAGQVLIYPRLEHHRAGTQARHADAGSGVDARAGSPSFTAEFREADWSWRKGSAPLAQTFTQPDVSSAAPTGRISSFDSHTSANNRTVAMGQWRLRGARVSRRGLQA